jgi:cation:H+ antiporter
MVLFETGMLIFSIYLLVKSSGSVVDNAVKLSVIFRVNQVAIGFLLLAVLSTLPEMTVSVISSSAGHDTIASGNAIGSVVANILLLVGAGMAVYGIAINKKEAREAIRIIAVATLVSLYIIARNLAGGQSLGFWEGLALIGVFIAYAVYVIKTSKAPQVTATVRKGEHPAIVFIIFLVSSALLILSAHLTVDYSVQLANILGLAQSFIGSTIVAVGTSLPEVGILAQAFRKKHYSLSIGNIVGANLLDMTSVLGVAIIIMPVSINFSGILATAFFAVIANVLLAFFLHVDKKFAFRGGVLMLALYTLYVILLYYLQLP